MVDYVHKELYTDSSVNKQLKISFDGGTLTNKDLYSESFELTESLCSEDELRFGCAEASVVKFKIAYNSVNSLVGKEITITEKLNGNSEAFQFGKYKVYSDKPDGDRNYRNITAYDSLYDIIQSEVSEWYHGLTFPMTLKKFRDLFFQYFGIEQEKTTLINDTISIEKTIGGDNISGKVIISAICEINGVFGHINRQGKFQYVRLEQNGRGLFPKDTLYPKNDLYPKDDKAQKISNSTYIKCSYEDFEVPAITKLQIRTEEDDIGTIVGDGDTAYVIQDNFLVYGKGATELKQIANNILPIITNIVYRPFECQALGNPCLEVGDFIRLYTRHSIVETYILHRTIKGIQALRDTYMSDGNYEYSDKVNSVMSSLIKLRGKTNLLERNVEETKSTITDVEKGLQSQITQNAEAITQRVESTEFESYQKQTAEAISQRVKSTEFESYQEQTDKAIIQRVAKGTVSSEISQESDKINISANRLTINSTYFALTEDGKMKANSAEFTGTITASVINNGNGTFYVDEKGNLTARSVEITSGKIGGLNIYASGSDYYLETQRSVEGYTSGIGNSEEWSFWAGYNPDTDTANFWVTSAGEVHMDKWLYGRTKDTWAIWTNTDGVNRYGLSYIWGDWQGNDTMIVRFVFWDHNTGKEGYMSLPLTGWVDLQEV